MAATLLLQCAFVLGAVARVCAQRGTWGPVGSCDCPAGATLITNQQDCINPDRQWGFFNEVNNCGAGGGCRTDGKNVIIWCTNTPTCTPGTNYAPACLCAAGATCTAGTAAPPPPQSCAAGAATICTGNYTSRANLTGLFCNASKCTAADIPVCCTVAYTSWRFVVPASVPSPSYQDTVFEIALFDGNGMRIPKENITNISSDSVANPTNNPPKNAFDENNRTSWNTYGYGSIKGKFIRFDLTQAAWIQSFWILHSNSVYDAIPAWDVQYSPDGNKTWVTAWSVSGLPADFATASAPTTTTTTTTMTTTITTTMSTTTTMTTTITITMSTTTTMTITTTTSTTTTMTITVAVPTTTTMATTTTVAVPTSTTLATTTTVAVPTTTTMAAATSTAATTANRTLTVYEDYDTTVAGREAKFIDECSAAFGPDVVCRNVRRGSIKVDIQGSIEAVTAVVQSTQTQGFVVLPSFGKLSLQPQDQTGSSSGSTDRSSKDIATIVAPICVAFTVAWCGLVVFLIRRNSKRQAAQQQLENVKVEENPPAVM